MEYNLKKSDKYQLGVDRDGWAKFEKVQIERKRHPPILLFIPI